MVQYCPASLHLGVSENSVPLNPMVNDHYYLLNGYNWEYTLFSDKPICALVFADEKNPAF
jgi:hypothetical protein